MSSDATPVASRPISLGALAGSWAVAYAFLIAIGFTTVPTPLWLLFAVHDGLSSLLVTVAFAIYCGGVVGSLVVAHSLSDVLGRRLVLLSALALEAVAAVLFLVWSELPGLLVARLLSGIGAGAVIPAAVSWISELRRRALPDESPHRAELISSTVNLAGLGFGAVASGVLAQWVGDPLRSPFVASLIALALAAVLTALTPETHVPAVPRPRLRIQRFSVPGGEARRFLGAAVAAFVAFAAFGLFVSVTPIFLDRMLDHPSHALAGAAAGAVFASGVAALLTAARWERRRLLATGIVAMPIGLAAVVAVWAPSLAFFLAGGIVAGGAAGMLFRGAVATGDDETIPALFLAAYIGLAVPVVGLGVLTEFVSHRVALLIFAIVVAGVTLVAAPLMLGGRRAMMGADGADRAST